MSLLKQWIRGQEEVAETVIVYFVAPKNVIDCLPFVVIRPEVVSLDRIEKLLVRAHVLGGEAEHRQFRGGGGLRSPLRTVLLKKIYLKAVDVEDRVCLSTRHCGG